MHKFRIAPPLSLSLFLIDLVFFLQIKGIPQLMYGLAAIMLITHIEDVQMPDGTSVPIFFLYKEDKGSFY